VPIRIANAIHSARGELFAEAKGRFALRVALFVFAEPVRAGSQFLEHT